MVKMEPLVEFEKPKNKVFEKKAREETWVTQGYVVFERKLSNFDGEFDILLTEGSKIEVTWLLGKTKDYKPQ